MRCRRERGGVPSGEEDQLSKDVAERAALGDWLLESSCRGETCRDKRS